MALRRVFIFTGVVAALAAAEACSSDNSGQTNDAGSSVDGAASGSGSSSSSGMGSSSSGAGSSSGAKSSSSSSGSSSGSSSDGGGTSSGSSSSSSSGGMDAGQMACTLPPYTNSWPFSGTTLQNWSINSYSSTNLIPGTAADGAVTGTVLAIDPAVGNPSPGSVKLTMPFDGVAEQLIFQQLINMDNNSQGDNLTGATLSAQVRLDSTNASIDSSFSVKFALKATAAYVYAEGPAVTLQEGSWTTVTMSVDSAAQVAGFDTCHVFEIDLLINSGNTGTYMGNTVMHIDTIAVSNADGGVASDSGTPNEGGGGDGGGDSGSSDGGSSDGAASDGATDASGQ